MSIPETSVIMMTSNVFITYCSIGGAIVAVGTHQGFLAADPEKVSNASVTGASISTLEGATGGNAKEGGDELDCIFLPFSNWNKTDEVSDSVMLDMGSVDEDDNWQSDKLRNKPRSFRIPASIKARLAVRKKPVITWRPYTRQLSVSQDLPLPVVEGIPDEFKNTIPENLLPGEFEDECAFMWRTIEDDSDSLQTPNSLISEDPLLGNVFQDSVALSHYKDMIPQPPELRVEDHSFQGGQRQQRPMLQRSLGGIKRTRYRTRGRMRCCTCSMPLLSSQRKRATVLPDLARSLSEDSVFLEAVAMHLGERYRSQDKPPIPTLKRPKLTLTIPPTKVTLNGKKPTWPTGSSADSSDPQ